MGKIDVEESIPVSEPVRSHLDRNKIIFVHNVQSWFPVRDGIEVFNDMKCPYNKCRWTTKKEEQELADLVLHFFRYVPPDKPRPPGQIYALYLVESPLHEYWIPLKDAGMYVW